MKTNSLQVASTFLIVAATLSARHEPLLSKNSLPNVTEACTVLQNFKGEYSCFFPVWSKLVICHLPICHLPSAGAGHNRTAVRLRTADSTGLISKTPNVSKPQDDRTAQQ